MKKLLSVLILSLFISSSTPLFAFQGELPSDMKEKIQRFKVQEVAEETENKADLDLSSEEIQILAAQKDFDKNVEQLMDSNQNTKTQKVPQKTSSERIEVSAPFQNTSPEPTSVSPEFCSYNQPAKEDFSAMLISVRKKNRVQLGEKYMVKVFLKNTGNTPWFSQNSGCAYPKINLGLDKPRDRNAIISDDITSRVVMDQLRIEPNEIASFTFWQNAPKQNDLIKDYYTPVIEGVKWLDSATFSFDTYVGDIYDFSPLEIRQKLAFAMESGSALDIDLNASKRIEIVISEQKMYLYLGDDIVREFRVSTGKASTPTPYGETKITLKQEVRVAAKYPHYIMPKFMMFRAGGYGIHALPSLGNDRGRFWTEARSHIGIPVSHGCIRLLPEDADFLFDFTPIGTPVVVKR